MATPTTTWTAESTSSTTWLMDAWPGYLLSHLGTIIESSPGVGIKTKDPGTDWSAESTTSTSWTAE